MTKRTTNNETETPASNAAEDVNAGGNDLEGVTGSRNAAADVSPSPNIKFVGRKTWDKEKRKVLKDPQPIEQINGTGGRIDLPPAAFQISKRLFYHNRARSIVRAFPHLYKVVISKRS